MLTPFLVERRLLPKVWGGRALQEQLGIALPPGDEPYGESWELFDRPDGASQVRGTETTIGELVRKHPEQLVGRGVPLGHDGSFPLLLKFLDAQVGLSLQVHPDDGQAQLDMGKDECCLILQAADDARIVHGVKPGVSRDEFVERWETDDVEGMVYSFRPEVGDLVHIPPGTPHGIGPGVLCFEVQQNSDLTYRFYDWGRGRETHTDAAKDVLRMVVNDRPPVRPSTSLADGGELLIATRHFVVRRYETQRRVELPTNGGYLTVTALRGAARLQWGTGDAEGSLEMSRADTAVVPACVGHVAIEPRAATPGGTAEVDLVVCGPGGR